MFGLLDKDIEYIKKSLYEVEGVEKAVIFGSRAIGNYKKGSDIDIALIGKIEDKELYKIEDTLNEVYPLPYFFDILDYSKIKNENLKKHIDEEGKVIYDKGLNY
ncbi:MAG: nucleotidyltransferase family protein [Clostridium sp.]